MKTEIIQSYEGELYVGTWAISTGLGIHHYCVKRTYTWNYNDFIKLGPHIHQKRKTGKKGGVIQEYLLNVPQIKLLIALLRPYREKDIFKEINIKLFAAADKSKTDVEFFSNLEYFLKERLPIA